MDARLDSESGPLFAQAAIEYHNAADLLAPAAASAVADAPACRTKPARRCRTRRGLDKRGVEYVVPEILSTRAGMEQVTKLATRGG